MIGNFPFFLNYELTFYGDLSYSKVIITLFYVSIDIPSKESSHPIHMPFPKKLKKKNILKKGKKDYEENQN